MVPMKLTTFIEFYTMLHCYKTKFKMERFKSIAIQAILHIVVAPSTLYQTTQCDYSTATPLNCYFSKILQQIFS